MRLSKLKLAGFKSFVDPTTIHLPSNLTGVVGPNGCGKSNVIDAVRWVMGEISAKHLRGQDMTDVIFNGSGGRKPVGTASVELIFDNADGTIAGPYASFAEVSLKRQVARDGQSTYFINGARCRRKDITQLFLGTGLGSRSYAIIEQGMISRLIEAKPDDLRAFLEEAAGISKYKERRRETENRIAHTRENLDRLNDIREELDKQIRHLQRQALTARRYQALKDEERKLHAELLALKLRELDHESEHRAAHAGERERLLQAAIAELRAAEAAIEKGRARHAHEAEQLNAVQARYYQLGADAARCEQAIQHARELRTRQRADLEDAERSHAEAAALHARDAADLRGHGEALAVLEPALAAARGRESTVLAELASVEAGMHGWQQRWEAFTREGSESAQHAMVERARIEQLEARLKRSLAQRERVAAERDTLSEMDADAALAALAEREAAARRAHESAGGALRSLLEDVQAARESERALQAAVDGARSDLTGVRGQLVSLEAVQQAALGQVKGKVVEWLKGHALGGRPRLAQQLTVEPSWSRAVETVLGSYLEAVCVDGLDAVAGLVGDLPVGQVTFVGSGGAPAGSAPAGELRAKVSGPAALESLLRGVYAVERLGDALARRATLKPGESVITRDGVWIGRDWLRVSRDEDVHAGVIERERDIRAWQQRERDAERVLQEREGALQSARARIAELETARDLSQDSVNRLHREHADLRAQHEAMASRTEDTAQRLARLAAEAEELGTEIAAAESDIRAARQALEAALAAMESHESRRPGHEAERDRLRAAGRSTPRARRPTPRALRPSRPRSRSSPAGRRGCPLAPASSASKRSSRSSLSGAPS